MIISNQSVIIRFNTLTVNVYLCSYSCFTILALIVLLLDYLFHSHSCFHHNSRPTNGPIITAPQQNMDNHNDNKDSQYTVSIVMNIIYNNV